MEESCGRVYNLRGLEQNENMGTLAQIYLEFQNGGVKLCACAYVEVGPACGL